MKIGASSLKRRQLRTIPHCVASQRTIISLTNVFMTVLFISCLDPPAKLYTLLRLTVYYKVSSAYTRKYRCGVQTSCHVIRYCPLRVRRRDWNKIKTGHVCLFSTCKNRAVIISPNIFLIVRGFWVLLFTLFASNNVTGCPYSQIFNGEFLFSMS
jgi:hypothetical protein